MTFFVAIISIVTLIVFFVIALNVGKIVKILRSIDEKQGTILKQNNEMLRSIQNKNSNEKS